MTVSYIEREQADATTAAFYDKAEDRFKALLNIFKVLLDRKGLVYEELDIAADPACREELRQRLPRARVIPQIFIDGRHIGGWEGLCLLDRGGELDDLTG